MIYAATLDVELARLEYAAMCDALDADGTTEEESEALEVQLEEARERAVLLYGAEGFDLITDESLTLFVGDDWADTVGLDYPADWYVGFYSVAVVVRPEDTPLLIHGAFAKPLQTDIDSAFAYVRSIGISAAGATLCCETGELFVHSMS